MRRKLTVDALIVEGLEQALRRLAERGGFADQDGYGLAGASLAQQRGAKGLVALANDAGIVEPEPRAIFGKGLLDRLALGRRSAGAARPAA